jgi:hypothetical protein
MHASSRGAPASRPSGPAKSSVQPAHAHTLTTTVKWGMRAHWKGGLPPGNCPSPAGLLKCCAADCCHSRRGRLARWAFQYATN